MLNPATPVSWLDHTLEKLDLVLLMSVNPGFGGQQFIAGVLPKIAEARRRIAASGKDIWWRSTRLNGNTSPKRARRRTFVAGAAIYARRKLRGPTASARPARVVCFCPCNPPAQLEILSWRSWRRWRANSHASPRARRRVPRPQAVLLVLS